MKGREFSGFSELLSALQANQEKARRFESYLSAVSPERNLKLGYSIITDDAGRVVKDVSSLKVGQSVTSRIAKGKFKSRVEEI
jgi:exonuclease VII large subunit